MRQVANRAKPISAKTRARLAEMEARARRVFGLPDTASREENLSGDGRETIGRPAPENRQTSAKDTVSMARGFVGAVMRDSGSLPRVFDPELDEDDKVKVTETPATKGLRLRQAALSLRDRADSAGGRDPTGAWWDRRDADKLDGEADALLSK